ncbi:MAG: dioxygenase, partial [Ardenticatenales bacterium]
AILDFWHCDDAGQYDNTGFNLRGHQFADADGRWRLTTIVPGVYPGRTRHIHVRVQAPDGPLLTTQLYFPDEPGNASDGIFDAALMMDMAGDASGRTGAFDFVVRV